MLSCGGGHANTALSGRVGLDDYTRSMAERRVVRCRVPPPSHESESRVIKQRGARRDS